MGNLPSKLDPELIDDTVCPITIMSVMLTICQTISKLPVGIDKLSQSGQITSQLTEQLLLHYPKIPIQPAGTHTQTVSTQAGFWWEVEPWCSLSPEYGSGPMVSLYRILPTSSEALIFRIMCILERSELYYCFQDTHCQLGPAIFISKNSDLMVMTPKQQLQRWGDFFSKYTIGNYDNQISELEK